MERSELLGAYEIRPSGDLWYCFRRGESEAEHIGGHMRYEFAVEWIVRRRIADARRDSREAERARCADAVWTHHRRWPIAMPIDLLRAIEHPEPDA